MDRYAVIGNPISHSSSPAIHLSFARATGQTLDYVAIEGPPGQFAATVDEFRRGGGKGLNITVPFKLDAFAYADERSPRAELAGAVNAMKFENGRALGENFDGVGLVRDVVHNLGVALRGKRVLVLGAGGATRGALLPLLAEKPALLVIANRTPEKAHTLAGIGAAHGDVRGSTYAALQDQAFDAVFNATSASLFAQLPPVPADVFAPGALAYDMAYGRGLTPFLRVAGQAGAAMLADGVGMLAEQAAEAFAWWRGVRPDTSEVIAERSVPLV